MVNTLGMFLSNEERSRSRYAVESKEKLHDVYDPDLFVQGLVKVFISSYFKCMFYSQHSL
jgi:hypothetical protein